MLQARAAAVAAGHPVIEVDPEGDSEHLNTFPALRHGADLVTTASTIGHARPLPASSAEGVRTATRRIAEVKL